MQLALAQTEMRLEAERWGESGDPQRALLERLRPASMDVHLLYSRDGSGSTLDGASGGQRL